MVKCSPHNPQDWFRRTEQIATMTSPARLPTDGKTAIHWNSSLETSSLLAPVLLLHRYCYSDSDSNRYPAQTVSCIQIVPAIWRTRSLKNIFMPSGTKSSSALAACEVQLKCADAPSFSPVSFMRKAFWVLSVASSIPTARPWKGVRCASPTAHSELVDVRRCHCRVDGRNSLSSLFYSINCCQRHLCTRCFRRRLHRPTSFTNAQAVLMTSVLCSP